MARFGSVTGNPPRRSREEAAAAAAAAVFGTSDWDGSLGVSVEAAAVSLAATTSNHSNQSHNLLLLDRSYGVMTDGRSAHAHQNPRV